MAGKRFEVVMNEFDEVEYIMDKAMMEDRDFAEFIDFVEDVCKENEQLQQELFDSEYECICVHYHDNEIRRDIRIEDLKQEFKERFGRDFE